MQYIVRKTTFDQELVIRILSEKLHIYEFVAVFQRLLSRHPLTFEKNKSNVIFRHKYLPV